MLTVYGLKSCDTCRAATRRLKESGIAFRFHDFKADGLDEGLLRGWIDALGHEALINRRGTTWRGLPEAKKRDIDDDKAIALIGAHPALIKRPVFADGARLVVGFGPGERRSLGLA